jgi:hydroxymethylpyrimidine pyrophosphatase-like HAD family hydrolase
MQYRMLATDYDGTLASDGQVFPETVKSLERLRASGRKLIMVTGRERPELESIFPELKLFDVVVAENGGLIYWPGDNREEPLADPPPAEFLAEMRRLNVQPSSTGRVIFATCHPFETVILQTIQRLGIGYQIIFNKGSVMVLPSNVNKATGLQAVLRRMQVAPENCVGVGDAENDHAFLEMCAVAVAVQNALPALKSRCDLVTQADHGRGVSELIDQILADDLQSLGPRRPRTQVAHPPLPKQADG